MVCPVCGGKIPEGSDFCPYCGWKSYSSQLQEVAEIPPWKTMLYLAGLIDGEGSSVTGTYHSKEIGYYYLEHRFHITMSPTKEWIEIREYLVSVYGGRKATLNKFYRWTLERREDLLKFLDDFIPYLHIKRRDAEILRKSILEYLKVVDKGKTAREEWEKWLRERGIRVPRPRQ